MTDQDQAVIEWMESHGFRVVGGTYRYAVLDNWAIPKDQALFWYTICQKTEQEARKKLIQDISMWLPGFRVRVENFVTNAEHMSEYGKSLERLLAEFTPLQGTTKQE